MKIELEEFEYSVGLKLRIISEDETEYALLKTATNTGSFIEDDADEFFILTLPVSNGD